MLVALAVLTADLTLEANAHPTQIAEPWSLAPDVWVSEDAWTVGIVHSGPALDRFEPGASLCLDSKDCSHVWHEGGIDALYKLDAHVSPRARFLLRDIDPVKPAVTLGALLQWTRGRWGIAGDPYLQLGLDNQARGNRSALFLPVTLTAKPACAWAIDLRTGWNSEFESWHDKWHIPIAVGARASITDHVEVGAAIGWYSLLGPQNDGNARTVFVTTRWQQ